MPYERCNGVDIYFEDDGDESNPPIVFLHGVMVGLRFFEPQLTALSTDHRPIALDYRGHGRSSKTDLGHTVPQYARDVHAFLEQRGLENVVFVGWSMGAHVVWEYVDQFGTDRLRGIVAVDMSASAFEWADYAYGNTDLARLTGLLELVQTDTDDLIESLLESAFAEPLADETRQLVVDELTRSPPPIKSAIVFDYTMRDYRNVLPDVDVPVLVIAGADETWRTVAAVEDVAERLPDAKFRVFEESGHCPTLEEPARFTRAVTEFVESL